MNHCHNVRSSSTHEHALILPARGEDGPVRAEAHGEHGGRVMGPLPLHLELCPRKQHHLRIRRSRRHPLPLLVNRSGTHPIRVVVQLTQSVWWSSWPKLSPWADVRRQHLSSPPESTTSAPRNCTQWTHPAWGSAVATGSKATPPKSLILPAEVPQTTMAPSSEISSASTRSFFNSTACRSVQHDVPKTFSVPPQEAATRMDPSGEYASLDTHPPRFTRRVSCSG
mmetsp:Transcript_43991/g.99025  ORF Transcript_43991/g.99025 Transcript_43991/m.99025 type:complete len:225 (+) Transcript_43991:292-966(+)